MAWQTGMNSSRRSRGCELGVVAILGDRHAAHQLHDEVGAAGLGRAGVEHARDILVVHERQRLPLGLESRDDLVRVHPSLDDLERDPAADRLDLLGHEDRAHAPLADLLEQLVRPDPRAWSVDQRRRPTRRSRHLVAGHGIGVDGHQQIARGAALDSGAFHPHIDDRLFKIVIGPIMRVQEGLDATAQVPIAPAFSVQHRLAVCGVFATDGLEKDPPHVSWVNRHEIVLQSGSAPQPRCLLQPVADSQED